jgi:hypothetical protein
MMLLLKPLSEIGCLSKSIVKRKLWPLHLIRQKGKISNMQPMKPEQKRSVLENSPQAQPSDLEEYERLLSLRFTEDPDQQLPAASPGEHGETGAHLERENRIKELHRKLFSSVATPAQQSRR